MLELLSLNLISLYIKSFPVSSTALIQLQPIELSQAAKSTQHTPLQSTPDTIELAKGKPYQSTYERENVDDDDNQNEEDLEEIRRRDYERREDGYDENDNNYNQYDNYDRSNRDRSDDESWQYQRRREVLEEQKREIENQIEELDNTYRQ
ncbi:hypothetical protein STA3757_46170 [Stanieria sp. NIES-3757]|nr:hypothetical protein STA3757_46170 [Stanieria sp. NIES-3757]